MQRALRRMKEERKKKKKVRGKVSLWEEWVLFA